MLPGVTLPASLAAVLQNLRGVFTAPSFATFAALATGLIANAGAGTATGMLSRRRRPRPRCQTTTARPAWGHGRRGGARRSAG